MYAVLALALFVQFAAARYLAVGGVSPDLVIACVIFFGLYGGPSRGFEAGLAAGFAQDVFVLDYFGINAVIYAASGMYAGSMGTRFSKESRAVRFLLVGALAGASMTVHFALEAALSAYHALPFGDYLAGTIVPGSLLTALAAAAVFPRLVRAFALKDREEFI